MTYHHLASCCVIFVGLLLSLGHSDCLDNITYPLKEDAYHWPSIHTWTPFLYSEWWYFAFYDPVSTIGFAFDMLVFDPKEPDKGHCSVEGVAFYGSKVFDMNVKFPTKEFSASTKLADVTLPTGSLSVNPDTGSYHLKLVTSSSPIVFTMDLVLTPLPGVTPAKNGKALGKFGQLIWYSHLPGASVSGVVGVSGVGNFTWTDVPGFHDHQWGDWDRRRSIGRSHEMNDDSNGLIHYGWSQLSDPSQYLGTVWGFDKLPPPLNEYIGFAFVRLGSPNGNGSIVIRQTLGTFCANNYSVKEINVTTIQGKRFLAEYVVETENEEVRFRASVRGEKLAFRGSRLDMICWTEVDVYQKIQSDDGGGSGEKLVVHSEGYGFTEVEELS